MLDRSYMFTQSFYDDSVFDLNTDTINSYPASDEKIKELTRNSFKQKKETPPKKKRGKDY